MGHSKVTRLVFLFIFLHKTWIRQFFCPFHIFLFPPTPHLGTAHSTDFPYVISNFIWRNMKSIATKDSEFSDPPGLIVVDLIWSGRTDNMCETYDHFLGWCQVSQLISPRTCRCDFKCLKWLYYRLQANCQLWESSSILGDVGCGKIWNSL